MKQPHWHDKQRKDDLKVAKALGPVLKALDKMVNCETSMVLETKDLTALTHMRDEIANIHRKYDH